LRTMSGAMPSLSAYPADQRGRMESLLNALQLRTPEGGKTTSIKA
jgi:penicillin-binding protein 2